MSKTSKRRPTDERRVRENWPWPDRYDKKSKEKKKEKEKTRCTS